MEKALAVPSLESSVALRKLPVDVGFPDNVGPVLLYDQIPVQHQEVGNLGMDVCSLFGPPLG